MYGATQVVVDIRPIRAGVCQRPHVSPGWVQTEGGLHVVQRVVEGAAGPVPVPPMGAHAAGCIDLIVWWRW